MVIDRYHGCTTREKARKLLDNVLDELAPSNGPCGYPTSEQGRRDRAIDLIEQALLDQAIFNRSVLPAARGAA